MAASSGPLRVALLGFGVSGEFFHAPFIAASPDLELAVVVTSSAERAERVREVHPGASVVASADQVWEREDTLDLVVLATPNRTHLPLALRAVTAGLPVLIDKPLALTVAEGAEIVAASEARSVPVTVFQNRRWDGDFLTISRLVADGALGEVNLFESGFERWRPVPKPGWRESETAADGGGILTDLGSHLADQALHLFGPVSSVYAEVGSRRSAATVDDDAFIALTHASGTRSHLVVSAVSGQVGPRFRLSGSTSAYVKYGMDPQEDALRAGGVPATDGWGEDPPKRWGRLGVDVDGPEPAPTLAGNYGAFYEGVVAMIRDGAPPPVDPRDALATQAVLDAARLSSATSSVVSIPE